MLIRYSLGVLLALLFIGTASAQIVINEVDADQTSTDAAEFVELYNAGTSEVSLDGHVLVLFNGSDNLSYSPAFDLDGVTVAAGGYYVICGDAANVPNCDVEVGPGTTNLIQNGADAVALIMGNAADYPEDTAIPSSGVVDAIVYGTDDDDDSELLTGFGQTVQYNDTDTESIQRSPDGSAAFITATPTPGAANTVFSGPLTYNALLRGENEVPPVDTDAKGGVTAVLDGTTLTVTGSFAGLSGTYAASHLHGGAAGMNGPVVIALSPTVDADMMGGTFEASANTFTVRPTFADSIRAGLVYVNVHSSTFPSGEIRGQLGTGMQSLPFSLSGANEVPPVETDATGSGTVSLDGSTITVTGSFSGLTGTYAASHIHGGAAGENGGVVQALSPTVDADMMGGTFEASANTFTVRPTFADSIRAGLAYVNVHSSTFASGEIRGQIGTMADMDATSIASARAQGVGATVTIQGTITRSTGAFTYVQDSTAALAIRQTSGAFADSVASGAIAPGTTVTVTGELSTFNGLLQINGSDLTSFMITGMADVPEAQTVTLAELAANGEDYESELVTVEMVTIAAGSDTEFQAARTYQVTDASDQTNAVTLRVPNANDTTVDGTAIPTTANITAIVGQFNSSDPAAGYQLLVVDADDIEEATVANETDPSAALSLQVVNPIQGTTSVRFTLGTPGPARVELYDMLGRQVALLVDRSVDASEQMVTLDASRLAAGTYVLRLSGEASAVSKTVTVVR